MKNISLEARTGFAFHAPRRTTDRGGVQRKHRDIVTVSCNLSSTPQETPKSSPHAAGCPWLTNPTAGSTGRHGTGRHPDTGNPGSGNTAANLSPYNDASPLAAPTPATSLQALLLNSGGIKLTWNGTTANGTVYSV
ncbi:MAG: hypothetical protein Q9O74_07215, partial [Planctomycetota bacterium]|nr:hypothetical protein [Planctomycetota bacterium]